MSARRKHGRSKSLGSDDNYDENHDTHSLRQSGQYRSSLPIHSAADVLDFQADTQRNSGEKSQVKQVRNNQDRRSRTSTTSPRSKGKAINKREGRPRLKSDRPKHRDQFRTAWDPDFERDSQYLSAFEDFSPSRPEPSRVSTSTASELPRRRVHKKTTVSRKKQSAKPRRGITYLYTEKSSKSAHGSERNRSTSIEIRVEAKIPPAESAAPPCLHTDWNQAYEPKGCESGRSGASSKEPSDCTSHKRNTTTYCPEVQPASSDNSVLNRLTRGYEGDKVLKTEVTIMEKHRQQQFSSAHHKTIVKNMDNLKNPRNSIFKDNDFDDDDIRHRQVAFQQRLSKEFTSERYSEVKTTNGLIHKSRSVNEIPKDHRSEVWGMEPMSEREVEVQPSKPSKLERLRTARAAMGLSNSYSDEENHVFPFKQTISGNIKVNPEQITYENKKVAVLISDPRQTRVNIKEEQNDNQTSNSGGINQPPMIPTLPDPDSENESTTRGRNDNFRRPGESKYYRNRRDQKDAQAQDSDFSEAILRASIIINPRTSSTQTQTLSDFDSRNSSGRREKHGREQKYAVDTDDCDSSRKDFFEKVHYRMKRAINPDTNILVGGQIFPCHALALQVYSKFIDKKRRQREKMMEIEIPERIITAKEFRNLMDWVLIGESFKQHVVSKENIVGLFSASVYLDMPALREDCLEFVRVKVQEEDPAILKMYEDAGLKDNSQALMSLLSTKLSALFPKLYKSTQFLQMEAKELVTLLNSDTINIKSELDVYDAAVRWLLYDWDTRRNHTIEVMSTVRFGLLSPLQLTQIRHSAEARNMPDYAKIYSFHEVKKFLEDGLTYAIFRESYRDKPGELNRWVEISEIRAPKFRFNIDDEPDLNRVPVRVSFDDEKFVPPPDLSEKRNSWSDDNTKKIKKEIVTYVEEPNKLSIDSFDAVNVEIVDDDSVTSFRRESYSKSSRHSKQIDSFPFEKQDIQTQPSRRDIRVRAIVLIQARVRAWLAKRWYRRLIYSVITIQRWFRDRRRRINIRNRYTPMKAHQSQKHLTLHHHFMANAPRVDRLTLDESAAFIIFGGHDPTKRIGDDNSARLIYQLDVHQNVWKVVGEMPEPRVHSGAVRNKDMIIIFGGADPRYRNSTDKLLPVDTTWALNVESGKWHRLAKMQVPRRNFGYAAIGGKIFVFGGVDEEGITLSSCEAYDPDYNGWTFIESMDGPRTCMAVAKHNGKIWIVGGMTKYQSFPILKSVITYDIKHNRFSPEPSLPFAVCFASMASYGQKLFLIGGAGKIKGSGSAQSLSSVLIFENDQWTVLTHLNNPRHGHCQINMGRYVALLGGISSFKMEALDTVETFNMEKYTARDRVTDMPQKLTGVCGVILH